MPSIWRGLVWLWLAPLLMTLGSGVFAQTSSDDVLEDQFSCMADYLHRKHRQSVDIYVQAPLTGEFIGIVYCLFCGKIVTSPHSLLSFPSE